MAKTVLWVLRTVFVIVLFVAAVTLRVVVSGELELSASDDALLKGDAHEATVRAGRAAGWYAPGAPHVDVAYERLIALAEEADRRSNFEIALLAWRATRSAAIESSWLITPHREDLERANKEIARLESMAPRPPGTMTDPPAALEKRQLLALSQSSRPHRTWTVALAISVVGSLAGIMLTIRRGIDAVGRLSVRKAAFGLGLTGLSLLTWIVAVWRA